MKISIPRKDLVHALAIVKTAASAKPQMPVLANVAVGTYERSVDFTCSDLNYFMRAKVDATITGKGVTSSDFTVRANLFTDLVRSFSGQEVELEPIKSSVRIRCGSSHYTLGTLPMEDFPSTPRVDPISEIRLPQAVLRDLLQSTAYCTHTADEGRPMLCGSLFQINGELTAVGCDGRRLAKMTADFEEKAKAVDVIVPRSVISTLLPLLETDEKAKVTIAIGEKMVQFKLGEVSIISKIIDGKYPEYSKIIPKLTGEGVPIGRIDLLNALLRVNFLSDMSVLEFRGQMLSISSQSNNKDIPGDALETLLIPKVPDLKAKFNTQYLIEALDSIDDDEVLFFGAPNTPAVFKSKSKPWLAITAPISEKEAGKAPEKPADKPAEQSDTKQPEPAKK